MIHFACPTCKSALQSPAEKAGEKVACPKCGQRLLIPNPVKPAASNKTVLGSLLPSFAKPKSENRGPVSSAPHSSKDGKVNVTCPCCGRIISLPPHELSTVIQCARCLVPFNPSSFVASQTGVATASQQSFASLSSSGGESPLLLGKDAGVQPRRINLRVRFCSCLPATAAGLFFLSCLGLAWWLFWRGKATEAPNPEMMRYLPNYSQIILSIRPEPIAKSDFFRELARRFPEVHKLETEFEEGVGIPLVQVKQILIAGMNNDDFVFMCRLKGSVRVADIFANMKKSKFHEEKIGEYTLYVQDDNKNVSFCIAQKDLVLFGRPTTIRTILLREGPPDLSSGLQHAIQCADFSKDIALAMNSKDYYRKVWLPLEFDGRESHEVEDAMMRADAAVAIQATIDKTIEGRMVIHCKDTATAKELMRLLQDAMEKIKDNPHTPALILKALAGRRWSLDGTKIILTVVVDSDSLVKALERDAR